jgi:tRNA nucleotidyltransferase (CCA-adding enzyme)
MRLPHFSPGPLPAHRPFPPDAAAAARRLADHPWPAALLQALERLREGGHQAVLVGGTVRDALLERPAHQAFDVATDLEPEQVGARFERVEPVGLAHGSVLILVDGARIECTTFRREGAYPDARRPETVTFTRDLDADLARRDLTVNAMAFDPAAARLSDPFGGLEDLARGRLRAVGDPVERFREDALRPVRAARLSATLEMPLEEATRAALGAVRDRARLLAVERVRAEFERLMDAPRPSAGFELLRAAGLLELWMPELTRAAGVPQNRFHAHDVYEHSLRTCDAAPAVKPLVRWAALLHDIGKPDTRVERDGDGTFYGHAEVGARMADTLLSRLRFSNHARERIVHLVREHMFEYRPEWSDAAIRRWLRRVGVDAVADLFDLRIADVLANPRARGLPLGLVERRARIEAELSRHAALGVGDLAADGNDVMRELGVGPGPWVREILATLLEEVTERPEHNERVWLMSRIRALGAERKVSPRDA